MARQGTFAIFDDTQYRYAREMSALFNAGIREIIRRHAEGIRNKVWESMKAPKHGWIRLGKSGRWYVASAPGEAPAVDTGALYKSIRIKYTDGGRTATIGSFGELGYSGYLEEGTTKMGGPRPYMAPALANQSDQFFADMGSMLDRVAA